MKRLNFPYTEEEIRSLKVGDMVLITGKLFTGRDAIHKYLHEGNPSPVNLKNQIIYHCGPVVLENKDGSYEVKAAGPTTSIREEPYQWEVMRDHGIVGVIGKGGMGPKTLAGNKEYGCVYFHAIGGAAQVLAEKIKSVDDVFLKDEFGSPEAIWELSVDEFPVVVTMDSHGNSLHADVEEKSKNNLKDLL
jgi:tartrate/fumarate subfamily iron-sulfur-dependent hydro-lyase beta chain